MKNFTLIACLTLGLISCSNTGYEKKIPGSWCEPIPGRAQDVQGIKFQKDGKASSINMATLQYKSWKINGKICRTIFPVDSSSVWLSHAP